MDIFNLKRFHLAQKQSYEQAFNEIKNGKKSSHWMWYIFPQIAGLGFSEMSRRYAITHLEEAEEYLKDKVLSERLITLCRLLLTLEGKTAAEIFGNPDDMKLRSSMTLFSSVPNASPVFQQVIDRYFGGKKDQKTLELISGKDK